MVSNATKPAKKTTTPAARRKATPATRVTAKTVTPRQRTAAAKPGVPRPRAKQPAVAPEPVAKRPVRRRPLIVRARRSDGRALSFSERLAEVMHREFKHAGPVCHSCRMNASHLAALGPAPSPIAI